ncbi:hypothetical protein HOC54_01680 [Candidatus Peregrinibacteria bacterium]|nr:hypothetical protein [Candidatus Peregrinibacteria bacterium]
MKKIINSALLITGIFLLTACGTPESLSPPNLFEYRIEDPNNGKMILEGIAYKRAEILVYLDDKLLETGKSDSSGNFKIDIKIWVEGEHTIKLKQKYKEVSSDFSQEVVFSVDRTPPSGDLRLYEEIPLVTNQSSIKLAGILPEQGSAVINNEIIKTKNREFYESVQLNEGSNEISIGFSDNVGNIVVAKYSYTVLRDTIKPKYYQSAFACNNDPDYQTEEMVCLQCGHFTGPLTGTASAPFTGTVKGNVKSVKVNNTYLKWNDSGQINQRVSLYLRTGQNNYDVEIIDEAGNKTTGIYSVSWEDEYQSQQDNLYNQIEDLESRLEDLE